MGSNIERYNIAIISLGKSLFDDAPQDKCIEVQYIVKKLNSVDSNVI